MRPGPSVSLSRPRSTLTNLATLLAAATGVVPAAHPAQAPLPAGLTRFDVNAAGLARSGLLYAPAKAKTTATPVVFVFHGHGGSAERAAAMCAMFHHWPEAISVYLQGLKTPGKLTDPEGRRTGWQHSAGAEGDRDLKLVDETMAHLRRNFQVDAKRVFATGHSNGGAFAYLLWQTRPDVFCALAPSAAASLSLATLPLKPKPVMHIAGTQDPLVKYAWQAATMERVRQINRCAAEGKPWAANCTLHPSSTGAPLVAFIHPGTHKFPPAAPALIARFFREQAAAVK